MTSCKSTTQLYKNPILQPLHHQPTNLTYCEAQAMDVTGRDRHGSLARVRPPEGNTEEEYRTVRQDMR